MYTRCSQWSIPHLLLYAAAGNDMSSVKSLMILSKCSSRFTTTFSSFPVTAEQSQWGRSREKRWVERWLGACGGFQRGGRCSRCSYSVLYVLLLADKLKLSNERLDRTYTCHTSYTSPCLKPSALVEFVLLHFELPFCFDWTSVLQQCIPPTSQPDGVWQDLWPSSAAGTAIEKVIFP